MIRKNFRRLRPFSTPDQFHQRTFETRSVFDRRNIFFDSTVFKPVPVVDPQEMNLLTTLAAFYCPFIVER